MKFHILDEQTRRGSFKCIFPLGTQTQGLYSCILAAGKKNLTDYLQFITLPVYSNLLLTQWQIFQSNNASRQSGIDLLESYVRIFYFWSNIATWNLYYISVFAELILLHLLPIMWNWTAKNHLWIPRKLHWFPLNNSLYPCL